VRIAPGFLYGGDPPWWRNGKHIIVDPNKNGFAYLSILLKPFRKMGEILTKWGENAIFIP
jgi:hypothetical protein